jgi:dTDP-4-dehydrorhamnose 3,5-epimerase
MPFDFISLSMPDVVFIEPRVFKDDRGFFLETYKYSEFAKAGIKELFVQDNHSFSCQGVIRGLHYQKEPDAQGKLVYCVKGKILDIAVDIRKNSPFFRKWIGKELSDENKAMLYIPAGFAHGFVVLSETADVVYKCTAEYSPENDRGIIWNDPEIAIDWPVLSPILSDKDRQLPLLREADL